MRDSDNRSSARSPTPPPAPPPSPTRRRTSSPPTLATHDWKNFTTISPPYLWATNQRATVHNLEYLRLNNLKKISGDVVCKKCKAPSTYEFDLDLKFAQVAEYISHNKNGMEKRAPPGWLKPELPTCNGCGEANCLKPVMPDDEDQINWLFLLLGQMLGVCSLAQLKYLCKFTNHPRTAAKDRLLYLAYLALCKQLDPSGPFDA